jgi:hypothetical protein
MSLIDEQKNLMDCVDELIFIWEQGDMGLIYKAMSKLIEAKQSLQIELEGIEDIGVPF